MISLQCVRTRSSDQDENDRDLLRSRRRSAHTVLALLVYAVFVLLAFTAAASAATALAPILYVDKGNPSCSDSGTGSLAQPFCTIGSAAASVIAGQTVRVAAGIYPEVVTVSRSGTPTAPIVFEAAPGAAVTLSGQSSGFVVSNKAWVTIDGFAVNATSSNGIHVSASNNITLSDSHVSYAGLPQSGYTKSGIYLHSVTDSRILRNTVDHNSSYGISLVSGSTRNDVRGNVVFSNAMGWQRAASGIRLYAAPSNTISSNVCHDNEDSGIESYSGSSDNLIVNNVSYKNGDHGIDNYNSTGARIIANTVYKNVTAGINVESNSTGATIANNISVDNGIASPRTRGNIRVESSSTAGTTMDNDLVYLSVPGTLLIWNSVSYTSLATFNSSTGQESHGLQTDPKWQNRGAGDFHLSAGSPAIDSANSGASGQQDVDAEGAPRTDDPGTPNTGSGPRAYDDRGALEFAAAPLANLVMNPGFETDISGWNTSGSGANITLTRVPGGHSGGWAAQISNTGTTTSTYAVLQDSPNWVVKTSAGTYNGSVWVRATVAGATFKLKFQEYNGTTLVGSAVRQVALTTNWQQVSATYTVGVPGSTLNFLGYVVSTAPGAALLADDASIVLG